MINGKRIKYKFPQESLDYLQEAQVEIFKNEFKDSIKNGLISIDYKHRGYKVNTKEKIESIVDNKIQAISIFSGAGGLDIGAQMAGARIISSLDFDKDSVETMKQNKYFAKAVHFHRDVKDITVNDYSKILKNNNPEKLIMIGGPPCTPFSKAGYWVTHKNRLGNEDPRNMIGQYLRLIEDVKPDGFLLENVESILHPKNKVAIIDLKEAIDKLDFKFILYRANALEFGVSQKRKRIFLLASKKNVIIEPTKTHGDKNEMLINKNLLPYERVIDWIGKFDSDEFYEPEESITGKTYELELKEVPPGQNYFALTERESYPNPKFKANKRFWSFLLKLHPDQPSWTIAAQPGPWVGPFHWNNRRLRVPEIAAIQTFPEDYIFFGSRRSIQKQIGNAVPSLLGKAMVSHLINYI